MIFRKEFLEKIESGHVRVAYRRWRKLSIKVGGTLKTPAGLLMFTKVKPIDEEQLTDEHAKAAGFKGLNDLIRELRLRPDGDVYEIRFKRIGDDPRIALRQKTSISAEEMSEITRRFARMEQRSRGEPWILELMELLQKYPGTPSSILAPRLGIVDVLKFKAKVRQLKELGLTISLGTGYKLSPRGRKVLRTLQKRRF